MTTQTESVQLFTGANINGVQTQAEVLMQRHTPTNWPLAPQALRQWTALNQKLNTKDIEVPIKALAMSPKTGGIYNHLKNAHGNMGISPTKTALQHLVSLTSDFPSSAVENLMFYPPETRALMFANLMGKTKDKNIYLRTAVRGIVGQTEDRVIRAATSDLHSLENGDDQAVIQQIERLPDAVLANARMRVTKEWDFTHVEIVIPNKVKEVRPGVVINARINIENSETKGGSFVASVGTMNLVCLNGMVGGGSNSTVTVRHMGDIRTKVRAGVVTVIDLVDVYLEEYLNAYKAQLPGTRAEAIAKTQKRFKLPETTATALTTLWDVDGERGAGNTVAGLANAMTRYAQSLPVEQALKLEEAAGKVVSMGLDAL